MKGFIINLFFTTYLMHATLSDSYFDDAYVTEDDEILEETDYYSRKSHESPHHYPIVKEFEKATRIPQTNYRSYLHTPEVYRRTSQLPKRYHQTREFPWTQHYRYTTHPDYFGRAPEEPALSYDQRIQPHYTQEVPSYEYHNVNIDPYHTAKTSEITYSRKGYVPNYKYIDEQERSAVNIPKRPEIHYLPQNAIQDRDPERQVVTDKVPEAQPIGPNTYPEGETSLSGSKGYSNLQKPLWEFLKQSAAINYIPKKATDPFDFLRDSYELPKGFKAPLAEYDYVIVGAGSAGSVLASRLSEDKPRATVLLIEAGKPEMLLTDVPAIAPVFQATDYAYQYYMEYQPGVCMGMINQRCFWPRGRAVGGTSVINYMIYTRGRPQDWDRIAADGNYGWSYGDVLKYYIKSEMANLRNYTNLPYRGRKGKQAVEFVPFRTRLASSFLEAGRILGHPTVDYNAPDGFGFGYVQSTIRNGRRESSAKAYLYPHRRRRNLHVLPETVATKVLIDPQTKRAYGVEYVRNRLRYTVRARREVILSAGPIASPQLLMLSGVGPAEHLRSLGIPVIQNLNVGRTLYDHICFPGVVFKLNTTNVSLQEGKLSEPIPFKQAATQWSQFGDGPMASTGGVEGIGYIKTPVSDDPEPVPDVEFIDLGGSFVSDAGGGGSQAIRRGMRIRSEVFSGAFGPLFATDTWSAFPMLLHPKSKGYLELRDANPFSFPKMYGNYLTDRRDVATFIAAIRHLIELANTEPFQKYGATLHPAEYASCRQHRFNTDAYWECALRTLTATLHHQIATCKMGPDTDRDAVVDPELRVYGIRGLRVVDTSIIPRTTAAHTNAPGMMIGEKAADMIKQTWSNRMF